MSNASKKTAHLKPISEKNKIWWKRIVFGCKAQEKTVEQVCDELGIDKRNAQKAVLGQRTNPKAKADKSRLIERSNARKVPASLFTK